MDEPKLATEKDAAGDELTRLRAELQDQIQHSLMLQGELDETNRGVVVLYAELDDQAEQLRTASRRSESKFQTIYAQAPSGIALLDDEGRIVDGNPALARLLTMVDVDVVGRRLSEFVPVDFAPRVDAFCSPSPLWLQGQEVPVKRPDGSLAYVEWNVSSQIEPGITLVVATDVSQRVELEQRRLQWFERERAARGEAEQGLRMKDGFIAVLSHELRTPLNAIMGWAQVLINHGGSELAIRGAAAIERNCATQARMIADLLDMSRLNMGKLAMSFERVDPLREVAAAIEAMKPAIDQKSMRVELEASDHYLPVRADASRFQQVVWNLLGNAIKFSVRGGLITVRLVEDDTGLRMRVTDCGQGIGADFLPFVFDRFAQSDEPGSRQRGGLGLGLAIVKHIVGAHGGTIVVHSDGPGLGTMFEVWLPVDRSPVAADIPGSRLAAGSPRSDEDSALSGVTALVVDDDEDVLEALRIVMSDRGARVLIATGVDEALRLIDAETPDILVSDIGMPGRDGYDLLRAVRTREAQRGATGAVIARMPAIAHTAFSREQDVEQAAAAGFDAHCAKPLRPVPLMNEMRRLLGRD